jgi:hypothetical protein
MKSLLIALFVLLLGGEANAARARPIGCIAYGWGETIVPVRDVPAEARAELRKATNRDLAIGFCYRHWFLFGDGFDFWTWNGQFVLFQGDRYWPLTDEDLVRLLGKDGAASLSKPLGYHIPVGLVTALVLTIALGTWYYRSADAETNRLFKDVRYQKGLEIYSKSLRENAIPTREDTQKALAESVEYLDKNHGIPASKAEPALCLLVNGLTWQQSQEPRQRAVAHEQAAEWELAIAYFQQAASLREGWDPADHAFLMKCIQRVRDKQARDK